MVKRSDEDYELDPNVNYFTRGLVFCISMIICVPVLMYFTGKIIFN
jgi:hypothetical protein